MDITAIHVHTLWLTTLPYIIKRISNVVPFDQENLNNRTLDTFTSIFDWTLWISGWTMSGVSYETLYKDPCVTKLRALLAIFIMITSRKKKNIRNHMNMLVLWLIVGFNNNGGLRRWATAYIIYRGLLQV
jgi:hypothetical protein